MEPIKFIILPLIFVGACIAQETLLKSVEAPAQNERGALHASLSLGAENLAKLEITAGGKLIQEINVPYIAAETVDVSFMDISGDGLEDLLVTNDVTKEGRPVMQAYIWRNGFFFKDEVISDKGEIVITKVPGCVFIEQNAQPTPVEKAQIYCITKHGNWNSVIN